MGCAGARCGAAGQIVGGRADDGDRLAHLVDAHLHAVQHVARLIDRHPEGRAVVGGVGMVAAHIEIDAGSAAADADDSQGLGLFGTQDAGVLQAVAGGIGRLDQCDQVELALHLVSRRRAAGRTAPAAHARRTPPTHTMPRSKRLPVSSSLSAQHHFPQPAGVGVGDHEADVRRDGSDIGDVVVDALQFQQDGAHERARGGTSISAALSTAWQNAVPCENAESPEMLSARNTARWMGRFFEELLGALVRVEHAQLQVEDGLAGDGEVEVAGLDDAGMNRADGNLEDAFSERRPVDVLLAFERRQDLVERKVLAQRMHVGPVIVQRDAARIRMARRLRGRTSPGSRAPASSPRAARRPAMGSADRPAGMGACRIR